MDEITRIWLYIANLFAAASAIIVFLIHLQTRQHNFNNILPKSLRLFVLTNALPAAIITSLASIIFPIHYLLYFDETTFTFKAIRFLISAMAQHVRGSLLIMVIERIISTLYLEKYGKYSSGNIRFIVLSFVACGTTILYMSASMIWIFYPNLQIIYFYLYYLSLFMHLIGLIVTKILHSRNKKMFIFLAYRVSLTQRYQVLENIKVLTFLWPTVLIFAIIAPWGLIVGLTHIFMTQQAAPSCLFLITYNFSFFLIILNEMRDRRKTDVILEENDGSGDWQMTTLVISPLGNALPTSVNSVTYFKDLQKQWS